jgi:ribosomal protein S13
MAKFHIHPWAKVGSLKNATVMDLTAELSNMKIENDLRREVQDNIRRLKDMGTYRGRRHAMGLPVRGQRTRTQVGACTVKGSTYMLTMPDHDRTKIEQDRTRRSGTGTAVDKQTGYHVSYCTVTNLHGTALLDIQHLNFTMQAEAHCLNSGWEVRMHTRLAPNNESNISWTET